MRKLLVFGLGAALASAVVACGDDVDPIDPTGSGGAGAQGGSGAQGPGGSGPGGSGGGDLCGNGTVDAGEACDGADLDGETCESLGFGAGTLSCTATCTFDDSQCPAAPTCGDGTINGNEVCDGDDLGAATCESEGFDAGDLACDSRCALDTAGCCENACSDGETQCNGAFVETCVLGASGCFEWSQTEDCSTTAGNVCDTSTVTCGPGGVTCGTAIDATSATFPLQVTGIFEDDPSIGASCDADANNIVWFKYTAPATDTFVVSVTNATTTNAWSRIVVFEGEACSPFGLEAACDVAWTTAASTAVEMTMGETYLIGYYTDGNTYTTVDPTLDIAQAPGGMSCDAALDISAETFPHTVTGHFPIDPAAGGSCSGTTPTNGVWFEYTPTVSDTYVITATNATGASASSRLAIFDGTTCAPLDTELDCTAVSGKTASLGVPLTAGQSYLLLFHTQGNNYPMVDPTIDVQPYPAGATCSTAIDLSAATLPLTATGSFIDDPDEGGSCDTTPNNAAWFTYTAMATGNVSIRAENFTTGSAQSRIAVFDGMACSPLGAEQACVTSSAKSAVATFAATAGTTYTVMFYTNGNGNAMVDPEIDVKEGVPSGWTCDPFLYDDGAICDCGCGDVDPDCGASPTAASCDTCDECGTDQCALFLEPTDIGMCTLAPGNTCSDPLPLVSGSFPWEGATNDFTPGSPSCTGATANGVDRVHVVTLNAGETLTVTLTPTSGDPSIYLVTDCADAGNTCVEGEDSTFSGSAETLTYTSAAGGTYYFVADRWTSGLTTAGYTLDVMIQ